MTVFLFIEQSLVVSLVHILKIIRHLQYSVQDSKEAKYWIIENGENSVLLVMVQKMQKWIFVLLSYKIELHESESNIKIHKICHPMTN